MRTRQILITEADLNSRPQLPTTPIGILGYYGLRAKRSSVRIRIYRPIDYFTVTRGGKHTKTLELSGVTLSEKRLKRAIHRMEECGYTVINKNALLGYEKKRVT